MPLLLLLWNKDDIFVTIVFGVILLIVAVLALASRGGKPRVFSHWYHLFENLEASSQKTYEEIENVVEGRTLPDTESWSVDHYEGGLLSAKREYLRVQRGDRFFDICAAPFGKGFFVSWWLCEEPTALQKLLGMIPFVGGWLLRLFWPETYYRHDTTLMFQTAVHSAVMEVLDGVTKAKGLRSLSEEERKPILRNLFAK